MGLLLVLLVLAQSCGSFQNASSGTSSDTSSSSTSPNASEKRGPYANGESEASGDRGGLFGLGGGEDRGREGDKEAEEPDKPYAAIPPPEGSEPLRDRFEDDGAGEQYGADPYNGAFSEEGSLQAGRMLVRGAEDPSDGPLKENRLVTYYGTPLSGYMGILGELPPEQMMRQLKKQTRAYSAADPERPAVPTIELIASVAQRNPGPDGLYLQATPEKEIRRYARLAKENDALLLLDIQLGRDQIMNEVRRLEPFLKQEHVHLAIDTEYSVNAGQVPGVDLGTVSGYEVQQAVRYMDRLVEKEDIPDKLVVVHQFETGIVYGKQNIQPTDDVQVSLNADGFGRAPNKLTKYDTLVRQQPIQYGGFKVFYRQDYPILSPDEVLQLEPAPAVVNYQ
jgi:hypothetical protein